MTEPSRSKRPAPGARGRSGKLAGTGAADGPDGRRPQLELFFDHLPSAVFVCDPSGPQAGLRITLANQTACHLYRYSKEELVGKPISFLIVPEAGTAAMDASQEFAEAFEQVHRRKDGSTFVADVRFSEMTVDGKPLYLVACRDITERKRAQDALRESEERFRLLVDTAFDGINICEADPATGQRKLVFCNDRFVEMSGYTREELQKAPSIDDLISTHWSPKEEAVQLERMERGLPFFGVSSWKRPDGRENYCEWSAVRMTVGDRLRWFGVDRDITERRRAEEALRASEERFRLLVDTAFDGINICRYDPETGHRKLLFCNDRYVEMSGRSRDELERLENLNDLLVDCWSPEEEAEQLERMEKGLPFFGVCSWKRPDGKENHYEWSAVLAKVGEGYHLFGVDHDVTERRKTEEALRASEERFRLFVDTAFDGINICELDPETGKRRLLFCNGRYVEMSGYAREDLEKADDLDDLAVDLGAPGDEQRRIERRDLGLPYFGTCSWKRPDGKENYYEWSAIRVQVGDKYRTFGVDRDITERRRAEAALQASEERFRLLVDTAFDGINICELDPETGKRRLLFCNDRYVEMSGYSRQQLEAAEDLGQFVVNHLSEDEVRDHVERIRKGLPVRGTASWIRPDGKDNTYEFAAVAAKVGDKYHMMGVDRDVTERKRAEEALRESEERFRRLVSTVFDGINICEYDPDTRKRKLLFCNDRYVEMSGFTREELEKADDLNALTRSHLNKEQRAENQKRLLAGLPYQGTSSWIRPDGKENTYEFSAVAVKVGDKCHLMGVDRDVTEREKAERELAQERELFQTLLDHIPDSIYFKDTANRFARTSKAKGEHVGVDPRELIGKTDADFYSPEEARRMSEDDERVMQTGRPIIAKEEKITRRDGEVRWVSATKVPRYDDRGHLLGTVGLSRDITDLKRAEEELKRRARELEVARQEADSANKAKGDFLANIGHEIRTPMNGILGMTELALSTTLTEEQREYLVAVQHSAQTLMALLNDLLDFSKIEAGKLELEEQPFDLERTISRLMEPLAVQANQKDLELFVDINAETPVYLTGDAHRLGQVIINLVGNAIKFTDAGEILLQVEAEAVPEGDGEVGLHFAVSDSGIGVQREVQDAIFESFRQGDSSTTRRYGGTGLGLAISKDLVEMMRGRIWVESPSRRIECDKGGAGSTFHFTVRCRRAPADWPPERRVANVRGARALIIDDNATNRRILHRMLCSWGMLPSEAASGEEAVRMVKQARFQGQAYDILLLDFQMPGMDGFDVASRLREEGDLSGTVVMMLTSSERRDHRARCRQLGIAHYLVKPVGSSDLLDSITRILTPGAKPKEPPSEPPTTVAPLSLSVLVAEDNEVNRKVAERMLEMAGCRTTCAATGEEVLKALEKSDFDAVLMDVQLPVLDGLETTKRIREKERQTGKHVPIVAMTAHAMKGDRDKCLNAGMDDYVSKPISREQLCSILSRRAAPSQPATAARAGRARSRPSGVAVHVSELLERVGGDVELARELLDMFTKSCPAKLDGIRSALASGDLRTAVEGAHELKGAAANLAAKATTAAAAKLERHAEQGEAAAAQEALGELGAALKLLEAFLSSQDWTDTR